MFTAECAADTAHRSVPRCCDLMCSGPCDPRSCFMAWHIARWNVYFNTDDVGLRLLSVVVASVVRYLTTFPGSYLSNISYPSSDVSLFHFP